MLFSATVKLNRLTLTADEQEASALARRDALTGLGARSTRPWTGWSSARGAPTG